MYLTVKEAVEESGKSQSAIYRFCRKYETSKYIKKENDKYLINKDFLMEKYPKTKSDIPEISDSEYEKKLLNIITEKNLQITKLTLQNKELKKEIGIKDKKIISLEDEVFDNQHELADVIDANTHFEQELSALDSIADLSLNSKTQVNIDAEKKIIVSRITAITISLMVLIAFIFLMYYFTN